MKIQTYIDKTEWGEGPWQHEPDRVQWTDKKTGLPCLIDRSSVTGALCGYVGVAPGHPLHGSDALQFGGSGLEVHGGVTWSRQCDGDVERGICHIPDPGTAEHVFWIGFDLACLDDLCPRTEKKRIAGLNTVYRPFSYCKSEVESLALQLKELSDVEK